MNKLTWCFNAISSLFYFSWSELCIYRYVFPVLSFVSSVEHTKKKDILRNVSDKVFFFAYNESQEGPMLLFCVQQKKGSYKKKRKEKKTLQLKTKKYIVEQIVNHPAISKVFYGNIPVHTRMDAHIVKGCMPRAVG